MKQPPFLLRLLRGAIGKRFVVKHYQGHRVVVTKYPDMTGIVPSGKQRHRRRLFKKAVAYARKVFDNPALREEKRRLLRRPRRLFQALVKEWLRAWKEQEYIRQRRLQRWQKAWQHNKATSVIMHPLPAIRHQPERTQRHKEAWKSIGMMGSKERKFLLKRPSTP